MIPDHQELIYLSLGSNLGDRHLNLKRAVDMLPPLVQVKEKSRIYETEPWGILDQPRFLNQVLCVESELLPWDLLVFLKGLEKRIGRKPGLRYGPREVDIDILLYGERVMDEDLLSIPHQRLQERAFVLVPLAEISPELILPGSTLPIKDLLATMDCSEVHPIPE